MSHNDHGGTHVLLILLIILAAQILLYCGYIYYNEKYLRPAFLKPTISRLATQIMVGTEPVRKISTVDCPRDSVNSVFGNFPKNSKTSQILTPVDEKEEHQSKKSIAKSPSRDTLLPPKLKMRNSRSHELLTASPKQIESPHKPKLASLSDAQDLNQAVPQTDDISTNLADGKSKNKPLLKKAPSYRDFFNSMQARTVKPKHKTSFSSITEQSDQFLESFSQLSKTELDEHNRMKRRLSYHACRGSSSFSQNNLGPKSSTPIERPIVENEESTLIELDPYCLENGWNSTDRDNSQNLVPHKKLEGIAFDCVEDYWLSFKEFKKGKFFNDPVNFLSEQNTWV